MDENYKKQWLSALESGKYQQGKSQLRDINDNFCCLGVLCDVVEPNGWTVDYDEGGYRHGFDTALLPIEIEQMVGLGSDNGAISIDELSDEDRQWIYDKLDTTLAPQIYISLDRLNDFGATFQDLAYFIRTYL